MKNIYFISDAHLAFSVDDLEREKRRKLIGFLDHLAEEGNTKELILVGDIFDFWFEWYHVVPRYWFPIFYRLRRLIDAGITVHFITGNHDFHWNQYLEEEVGLRCHDGHHEFELGGRRFFVAHGDGYARTDRGYRLLKRIIRNRLSVFLYKTFIPPDLGMKIAGMASHSSRKLVNIDKHAWAEEYYQFAREKFTQGINYVVLGHLHYPELRTTDNNAYLNCGDWIRHFSYGKYDGQTLALHHWKQ